jgi:hypothetical protein
MKLRVPGSIIKEQEGAGSIIQRTSREYLGQVLGNMQRAFREREVSGSIQGTFRKDAVTIWDHGSRSVRNGAVRDVWSPTARVLLTCYRLR